MIIGVDGGGTFSSYVAVEEDGTVVATLQGDGLNFNSIGIEAARNRLYSSVDRILSNLGLNEYQAVCVGLSALDGAADAELAKKFAGSLFDPDKLILNSDVHAALIGSLAGEPNVMVVSGTGSMVAGMDSDGEIHTFGGWGYRLNDPASAYGVATEGIKAALMSLEGTGPETVLGKECLDFFKACDARELIAGLYGDSCGVPEIAGFAYRVIHCAQQDDLKAKEIIDSQYSLLAKQTAAAMKGCPHTVSLYGGMFEHNQWIRSMFLRHLKALVPDVSCVEMKLPPELGAIVDYLKGKKNLTQEKIRRMRNTWGGLKQ